MGICICDKKCGSCLWLCADMTSNMENCDLSTLKYIKSSLSSCGFPVQIQNTEHTASQFMPVKKL